MKKFYKILICCMTIISLMVVFFIPSVSASTYRRYEWENLSTSASNCFFAFDNNKFTLVDNVDSYDFVSLSSQSIQYVDTALVDVGYEAYLFEYERSTEITNNFCFFSYAFMNDRVYSNLGELLDSINRVVLDRAYTQFSTFNGFVWAYRYSIRSLVDDYARSTFLKTDWYQPRVLKTERISNEIWQTTYDSEQLKSISFNSFDLRILPENFVVCLDIIIEPEHSFAGINKNLIGVALANGCSGSLSAYFDDAPPGVQIPSYPELENPYYEQPNGELIGEIGSLKGSLIDTGSLSDKMITLWDKFSLSIGMVSTGMSGVTSLLNYVSAEIPFVDIFIWFSLAIGIVSFIVGIGGYIGAAATVERRKRDAAYQRGITEAANAERAAAKSAAKAERAAAKSKRSGGE